MAADDSSTNMFGPSRPTNQQSGTQQMPSPAAGKAADFRNTALLDAYLSESGKIQPRRRTRMSAKDQRALVRYSLAPFEGSHHASPHEIAAECGQAGGLLCLSAEDRTSGQMIATVFTSTPVGQASCNYN